MKTEHDLYSKKIVLWTCSENYKEKLVMKYVFLVFTIKNFLENNLMPLYLFIIESLRDFWDKFIFMYLTE